jgi:hypothetical protein
MDIISIIREYYPRIDAGDFDWVVGIFAPDAVYDRADVRYAGIARIGHFFRVERQIRGVHTVADLWSDKGRRTVWATGVFEGQGAMKDDRRAGFADIWRFNHADLVERRQTYLAIGHDYVLK